MSIPENSDQPGRDQPLDLPAASEVSWSPPDQSVPHGADGAAQADQRDLAEADREQRAQRRARMLLIRADFRLTGRVRHPDGGRRAVVEIQRDEIAQRAQIEMEARRGSRKHNRLPRWLRRVPKLVLLFDFCLLLYFFAGITDVNWYSPLSANLGFAVLLAAMVTVLSYGFLSFTGHRMRTHKDHSGAVRLDQLDSLSAASILVAVAIVGILAALMFTRMRIEVIYALGPGSGGTALMIALTLAAVSAAANLLVVGIHALDGSDQVERLNKLSAAAHRSLARAHRMRERATYQASR